MNIQKVKKIQKSLGLLVLALLILNILLPSFVRAATITNATVTVKKVKYNKKDASFPGSVDAFQTDGRNFNNIPSYMSAYTDEDTRQYGKVEFAIYKLNAEGKKLVVDGVAKPELQNALKNEAQRKTYVDVATEKKAAVTGSEGKATLNVGNLDSANPELYAIVETTPAKEGALVVTKAEPMVLSLPHIDETGAIKDLNIVAKNEVAKNEIEIKKVDEKGRVIPEAKFELYKDGVAANNKIGNVLTANNQGVITLADLTAGKYYLVEKESKYVRDPFKGTDTTNKKYLVSDKALADSNNKVFFTVSNDGINITGSQLAKVTENQYKYVNNMTPFSVKKLKSDVGAAAAGSTLTFEVQAYVPSNIADFASFAVKDTRTAASLGAPTNVKADAGITITPKTTGADTVFTFNVDELKTKAGQFVTFTYDMKLADNVTSQTAVNNKVTTIFDPSKTTEPTAPNTHPIEVVTPPTEPHNDIPGGGSGSGDQNDPSKPGGNITIKTYKLTVESKQQGVTGTKLPKAEFVVKNAAGKYYVGPNNWGEKTNAKKFTTEDKGAKALAELDGLAKGVYTTELTAAPEGFKMPLDLEKTATLGAEAAKANVVYTFSKIAGLPLTGSDQLIVLGILGVAIIAAGAVVLKKRNN